MIKNNIWLIGTGYMAIEYAKVLIALNIDFIVIGRGEENVQKFNNETNIMPIVGGLSNFLAQQPALPDAVINAVGINNLTSSTIALLRYGVSNILLEKPGVGYPEEIKSIALLARSKNANVLLAYNRRFYASVIKAKELIAADGGVTSFHFEFTEWSHVISQLNMHPAVHHNWLLGNSTHIIDTAFYLCGLPKEMTCYNSGSLDWHPSGSRYSGAGMTESNALFSYIANWESPGRWNLEIMTPKHRYIFKPMEKLQVMNFGSVAVEFISDIDYSLDENYKHGIYLQTNSFLKSELNHFINIHEQKVMIEKFYNKISAYL